MNESDSVLAPHGGAIIDLSNTIDILQARFGEYFLNPKPGLYLPNIYEPIFSLDSEYLVSSSEDDQLVRGIDLLKVNQFATISTRSGKILYTADRFLRIKNKLTTRPTTHNVVFNFLVELIENELDYAVKYVRRNGRISCSKNFEAFFTDQGFRLFDDLQFVKTYNNVIDTLDSIIAGRQWLIYTVVPNYPLVKIEISGDYRAYKYYELKEKLEAIEANSSIT